MFNITSFYCLSIELRTFNIPYRKEKFGYGNSEYSDYICNVYCMCCRVPDYFLLEFLFHCGFLNCIKIKQNDHIVFKYCHFEGMLTFLPVSELVKSKVSTVHFS